MAPQFTAAALQFLVNNAEQRIAKNEHRRQFHRGKSLRAFPQDEPSNELFISVFSRFNALQPSGINREISFARQPSALNGERARLPQWFGSPPSPHAAELLLGRASEPVGILHVLLGETEQAKRQNRASR